MKISRIPLVLMTVISLSCADQKGMDPKLKAKYPQTENVLKSLDYIFANGFSFTDSIRVDRIGVLKVRPDTFKIYYFLDERTDFDAVEKLNVAFRTYPATKGASKILENTQEAKTFASKCSIKRMDNSLIVISDEFTFDSKKFKETKIYFYQPEKGIVGRTMTILGLNLSS